MPEIRGGQAIIEIARAGGVTVARGIPGAQPLAMDAALHQARVVRRHEQGVGPGAVSALAHWAACHLPTDTPRSSLVLWSHGPLRSAASLGAAVPAWLDRGRVVHDDRGHGGRGSPLALPRELEPARRVALSHAGPASIDLPLALEVPWG